MSGIVKTAIAAVGRRGMAGDTGLEQSSEAEGGHEKPCSGPL
jgi:hypothetical protein